MVHGNVGQSDLTREDMTRYIRYLVDVIGKEQKTLYSHLEDRTNPYICLHGECQTLANWISVLLEAYGESFTRWDMRLHFTVFGKRYSESTEAERPKQFDDWNVFNIQESGAYLHTLIEWDGLYWDANGGGTRREKEEYYEGMAYLLDGKRDRKRLLFNFIDWEEFKAYLDWPLTTDALDYEWEWVEIDKDWNWFLDSQGIYEGKEIIITDLMDLEVSNLAVFRDFINHLRMDDFTSETVPDWKIHSEVQRLHHREEDFYEGDIEERIEEFREYELQDIPFDLIHAPWGYDSDLVFDYAMQINEYDAMSHEGYDRVGDEWIVVIDPYHDTSVDITNDYPPLVVTSLYAPDPSEPWNKQYLIIDGQHRYEAIRLLRESAQEQGKPNKYDTVKAWVGKGRRAWITQPRDERGRFIRRAERIYFDDEYGGFIKGNPRANELPGEVAFPGEEERLAKIMSPEEYAELEQEVNLIVSNLPYNVESLSEDERIALHEDIILKIVNHEYIHQSIDDEVLEWAIENNKTKGDYYAAHEIMAYVDMALRESLGMRDFKLQLTSLVSQHPILTDNPDLADRVMDALTRTRKGQRFQVPAEIETLMRAFQAEDYEILVVGGAVRDMLMGLKPKDYDLATNATPEEVEAVVSELEGYRTVTTPEAQMARGVLTTLVLPPSGEVIEVTTFRAELGYEDGTRRPVAVAADTFYEDSLRRDFTMNALGWRLNGTILDYHEGVDDIEFGQLVAVGDASERLEEDPLRILRAVRFASRYGLEIDEELGAAIETNLPQLLTLSPERIRRELDTILKSEEGVYDLFETGILETIIPEYKGIYWGERHYDELPVITSVRSYGQIDRELTAYEQGLGWKSEPWQPAVAYALLLQGRLTREEFNERYRRGPISFSRAEADMIAELISLYSMALESEEPRDVVAIVTSPYYTELMLMLEYTNRSDLVDYFTPYRSRYKGKPPKGYAMTVADEYGIEPGPALGERLSEITEAIILGDIENWEEGLNYYASEEVGTRERIAYAGVILDEDTSEQLLALFETLIPESWTRYAHHMTVSLGKSIPNQADLGKEVTLTVNAVGKSDDAIAVAVSGYPSRNAQPHITLAVPPGGKPFNSNKITDWHSVEPFEITGQLQDIKTYVAEEIDTLHESLNYPRGFYSKRDNFRRASKDWTDWFDEVWDDFSWKAETVTKYAESFWGNAGSGVLVVARDTQRILLGLRSEDVNEPNTWGNFGGAIGVTDWGEPEEALPPEENALKEMAEEIGYTGAIEMMPSFTYRSPEFTYYNFIGIVEQESDVPLNQFNWEVSELQWFTLAEIMALPNLHFGVSALMSQEEMITFNAEELFEYITRDGYKFDIPLNNPPSIDMTNPPLRYNDPRPHTYDDFGNPFVTFYHATTMDNYESIEAFGLRVNQPGYYEKAEFETYDNVAGVYFTSDLEKAKKWIGWKYREMLCVHMELLEEDGYEVSLIPNEIAGVVYAVDFPLELVYDDLIEYKWGVQNLKPDPQVFSAWYSTNSIPRSKMSIVGFYSLPICLNQGWNDGGDGVQSITESMAKQIHERGFYVDAIPNPDYDEFRQGISTDSAMIAKHGFYQTPFTDATRRGRRYLPLHHILSPRDSIFSGFRGTFMAESIPMSDWSKLSPAELAKLSQFPTADDHMDGWDMYLPRDWPHWDVLERAEQEHWQMEQKYLKDNDLKYLPWDERHKLPYTLEEIYAKYFDFWYIPSVAHSMSGGGLGQIYDSLKEAYAPDTWKRESDKRGLPCQETLSLEEAAKYFSPQTIERYREQGRKAIHVWNQPIVNAYIDEHLALGREGIFYAPVIAAASVDVEVGTDATLLRGGARLLDGWHRDAYAGLLYDQDPSQGFEGPPTVFFKPKEEYL